MNPLAKLKSNSLDNDSSTIHLPFLSDYRKPHMTTMIPKVLRQLPFWLVIGVLCFSPQSLAQNNASVAGVYSVAENGTITESDGETSDSLPVDGRGQMTIQQTGNVVSYSALDPSGSGVTITRSGTINGNTMILSGPLVVFAKLPGLVPIQNSCTATGIVTLGTIRITSSGTASARYQGQIFTYTATTTALCFGPAVPASAPVIVEQPKSLVISQGGNAKFTTTVSGTPPITYQWSKDGVSIVGATNAVYSIANVQTNSAGNYRSVARNAIGSAESDSAMLKVISAVKIISDKFTFNAASAFTIQGVVEDSTGRPVSNVAVGIEDSILSVSRELGLTDLDGKFSAAYAEDAKRAPGLFALSFKVSESGGAKCTAFVSLTNSVGTGFTLPGLLFAAGPYNDGQPLDLFTLTAARKPAQGVFPFPSLEDLHKFAKEVVAFTFDWSNAFGNELSENPVTKVAAVLTISCVIPELVHNPAICAVAGRYLLKEALHAGVLAAVKTMIRRSSLSDADQRDALAYVERQNVLFSIVALNPKDGILDSASVVWGALDWASTSVEIVTNRFGQIVGLKLAGVSADGDARIISASSIVGGNVQIDDPKISDQRFHMTIQSISGNKYTLECKTALTDSQWLPLGMFTGTGSSMILSDTNIISSNRFYRVRRN